MDESTRIARNAASSYAARGLLMLSVLLVTPYLFRRLGPAGFGTWSVMLTLATIFNLLEIGFSDGIVRFVASFRAEGRRGELQRTISTGTTLMGAVGLAALAVAVAGAFLLDGLAAAAARDDFRAGMLVLGAAMLLRFPCVAWGAALKGFQRYELANASFMLTTVLAAVGAVAAIEAGGGLLGLAVAQAGALVAGGVLYGVSLSRIEPGLSLRPRLGRREDRRRIIGFSSFTFAAESFNFVGQRMDVVIIAAIRNAVAAAPYAAALKLQSGVQGLTLPFVDLLMPMASELWARREREELLRRLTIATRIAMQLTLPLAVGISLFAVDIVDLWLGPKAPEVTASIIVLLMAVQVLGLSAAPARRVLVGVGRVRLIALLSMIEGGASIALTVVFVSAYGAVGAAIATVVTVAGIAPLKFPLACRTLGYPTLPFLRRSIGAALLASAPGVAAMVLIWALMAPGAARFLAGLAAGVTLSVGVAVAEVGPGRIANALRTAGRRLGARPAPHESELGSPLPADIGGLPR